MYFYSPQDVGGVGASGGGGGGGSGSGSGGTSSVGMSGIVSTVFKRNLVHSAPYLKSSS